MCYHFGMTALNQCASDISPDAPLLLIQSETPLR